MKKINKILLMLVFLASFINAADYNYKKLQFRNGIAYKVNKQEGFSGRAVAYYENGQLGLSINYKDGKKNGLQEEYYPNGQLISSTNYKDGKVVDNLVKIYSSDGKLKSEINFKDSLAYEEGNYGPIEINFKDPNKIYMKKYLNPKDYSRNSNGNLIVMGEAYFNKNSSCLNGSWYYDFRYGVGIKGNKITNAKVIGCNLGGTNSLDLIRERLKHTGN